MLAVSLLVIASPRSAAPCGLHLRGALALALDLGLPDSVPKRTPPSIAFTVVALSVVAQGMAITPLLRRLGELEARSAGDGGP